MCKFDSVNLNTESNLQMNVSLEIVGGCHHHHTHVVHPLSWFSLSMSEITKTPRLSHEDHIDGILLHLFWEVFQVVADRLSQLQMFLGDSWDGMDDHLFCSSSIPAVAISFCWRVRNQTKVSCLHELCDLFQITF